MLEIEQAFISDFIAQSFGLPIAHENVDYTPVPGTAYVQLRMSPNDERAADLATTNNTTGVMQFTLYYPEGRGAMGAKIKRQAIFDAYPIGRVLTYSGQRVTVTGLSPFNAYPDNGWFKVIGRVFYTADITR